MTDRKLGYRIAALVAMSFGALTIVSGGKTLMGAIDMGAVVSFVLWFNTAAGFFYVAIGLGLWLGRAWTFPWLLASSRQPCWSSPRSAFMSPVAARSRCVPWPR